MSDQLAVLYEVQQADLELARLKHAISNLDTGEVLQQNIAAAERDLRDLQTQLQTVEAEYLDQELELKTLQEKKERFEGQLYGGTVRNPRQLGDLQEEVGMLKRETDRVETRILELMEELEQQRAQAGAKESDLTTMRDQLQTALANFETTDARLRREIAELEAHRTQLAERVEARLLKRYEQIRLRQNNVGLVKVVGDTCPGCRVTIPSQRLKAIESGRVGESCDNCGRLLMWGGPTG